MAKKGSSETSPSVQKETILEKKKATLGQEKLRNEIDEIFSSKKKRKNLEEQAKKPEEVTGSKPKKVKKKKKSKVHEMDGFVDPPSRPRKRTEDGLVLYTEEELGFGKSEAGGTPLCPFDCSCCF